VSKIQGRQSLEKKLERLANIKGPIRAKIREALAQNGSEITGQMKAVVPKDSGALAASIKAVFGTYVVGKNVRALGNKGGEGDPDLTLNLVAGDAEAWYAGLVEVGTKSPRTVNNYFGNPGQKVTVGPMPARPFFFPVYRANKKRAKGRVTRAMKAGIQEAIRG
jgi:HK97 gp10 family phage protein